MPWQCSCERNWGGLLCDKGMEKFGLIFVSFHRLPRKTLAETLLSNPARPLELELPVFDE